MITPYFVKFIHDSGRFVMALLSSETFRRLNRKPKDSDSRDKPLFPRSTSTRSISSPKRSESVKNSFLLSKVFDFVQTIN